MFNKTIFSYRLKLCKNAHKLNNTLLAEFLHLRSSSSINNLENATTAPSSDLLIDIADFFGVSVDWFAGRSDTPYIPEQLLKLENELLPLLSLSDVKLRYMQLSAYPIRYNSEYSDPKTRSEFLPAVRGNIIFILNVFHHQSLLSDNEFYDLDNYSTFSEVLEKFLPTLSSKERKHIRWKMCSICYEALEDYLAYDRSLSNPIFDITKPLE